MQCRWVRWAFLTKASQPPQRPALGVDAEETQRSCRRRAPPSFRCNSRSPRATCDAHYPPAPRTASVPPLSNSWIRSREEIADGLGPAARAGRTHSRLDIRRILPPLVMKRITHQTRSACDYVEHHFVQNKNSVSGERASRNAIFSRLLVHDHSRDRNPRALSPFVATGDTPRRRLAIASGSPAATADEVKAFELHRQGSPHLDRNPHRS